MDLYLALSIIVIRRFKYVLGKYLCWWAITPWEHP